MNNLVEEKNQVQLRRRSALKSIFGAGAILVGGSILGSLNLTEKVFGSVPFQYTGSDAYQIITQALAAGQTKIYLPAGNYSVSKEIDINVPNVEIYGNEQNATILTLNNNVYLGQYNIPSPAHVLNFITGADGFHVHDLQINGNAAGNPVLNNPIFDYTMDGVHSFNCSNGIIENCIINNCRYMAIQIEHGFNCIVRNNTLQNSNANGISINNSSNPVIPQGGNHQILNNLIDGASDVGISCYGAIGTMVAENTVQNITMNLSPYSNNSHVGLMAEGGHCTNVTFSNNTVRNISIPTARFKGTGMSAGPTGSSNIQFVNNTLENVYAAMLLVGGVTGLIVTGTFVNGTTSIADNIIDVSNDNQGNVPTGVDIEQSVLQGIASGMTNYIVNLHQGSGKFINNTIYANGNTQTIAVNPKDKTNWVITPNTIE